jgi:hypothetical protein
MKTLIVMLLWLLLLVACWPLAIVFLVAWPVLWLLSIPFRVFGSLLQGLLSLVGAIFMLPARLLGAR